MDKAEHYLNQLLQWLQKQYLAHFPDHKLGTLWAVAAFAFLSAFVCWWLCEPFRSLFSAAEPHFKKHLVFRNLVRLGRVFFSWGSERRLVSFFLFILVSEIAFWSAFGLISLSSPEAANLRIEATWSTYSEDEMTPTVFAVRHGDQLALANMALFWEIKNLTSEPIQVSELSFDVRSRDGNWEPLVRLRDLSDTTVYYVQTRLSSAQKIGSVLLSAALDHKSIPPRETINGLVLLDCTDNFPHEDPMKLQAYDDTALGPETVPVTTKFRLRHESIESDIEDSLAISRESVDLSQLKRSWERSRTSYPSSGVRKLREDPDDPKPGGPGRTHTRIRKHQDKSSMNLAKPFR